MVETLSEVASPVSVTPMTDGPSWLSYELVSDGVHVTADPTGLEAGRYRGSLTFRAEDTTNTPLDVPVDLIVWGPGPQVLTEGVIHAAALREGPVSPESWVSIFGAKIAGGLVVASSVPLPTELGGTTVTLRDSQGVAHAAQLQFVSPAQANFLVPAGVAPGPATVTITDANGDSIQVEIQIAPVAPGFFTANSDGVGPAAGRFVRVQGDGARVEWFTFWPDGPVGERPNVPFSLGAEGDETYVSFFGSGFRGQSSVSCTIGGEPVPVVGAVPQGQFDGLDQAVVGPLPRSLTGRGEVDVECMFDEIPANVVTVEIE